MCEQQILSLVTATLGATPLHATRMTFGHSSITFDVTLPDRHIIVRTNTQPTVFAHTARNLTALANLGLPVPTILAADLSQTHYPFAYLILPKIPGRDLRYELPTMTPQQMTRVAEQIVAYQRLVATLPPGKAYGWAPLGEQGQYASWWDLLQAELASRKQYPPTGPYTELVARLSQAIDRCAPYLHAVPPICFLDDVTTKNVIIENGELQGLIDFDVVCYGDPLFQIGLTATAVIADIGPSSFYYVEELCRLWPLTADQQRAVWLYAANFGLEFIQRSQNEEPPVWTQRMLTHVEHWLEFVER
ncbi:MAG: aminoglycoside phosphotransferase family protein [Thermomicrobiales bacterium]